MVVLMRYAIGSFLLVTIVAAVAVGVPALLPAADAAQETQVIEITAERFAFTPSEIRLKAGTPVELRLRSDDTAHGFHIIGTDIDIELPKRGRGVTTVVFEPKPGRYTFECSQLCGAGHSFMRGAIIVSE